MRAMVWSEKFAKPSNKKTEKFVILEIDIKDLNIKFRKELE